MKLGAHTACPARQVPARDPEGPGRSWGLTSAEINAGGFIPAPHLPVEQLLSGASLARGSTWASSSRPGSR